MYGFIGVRRQQELPDFDDQQIRALDLLESRNIVLIAPGVSFNVLHRRISG